MAASKEKTEDLIHFIEELKRQWVATIDALVDPLMIVAKDYTVTKCNQAMASLASESDVKKILGQKCYQVFANANEPCRGCTMSEAAKVGKPLSFSINRVRDKYYFEATSQPVYSPNGTLEGVVQIYRDRTEAKALQEQLLQSEKLASIGLLAGGIAHEINNPLGGILIFSQMLLREMPNDSSFYPDVTEIEAATQRCKVIVERLLDFARSQPSDINPKEHSEVNVTEAAKAALRFGKVHENAKKVEIEENWDDQVSNSIGDKNKFIQLFLNLIQNAFQAMPDGGTLSLSSRQEQRDEKNWGVWEVKDTGVGISEKHLNRIFDPFFTTKEKGEGTGLGLSICYGLCQEVGGLLEVDSIENTGTTFKVVLPLPQKTT